MKLNRKFIHKISLKKIWEYLTVFILFVTFLVDNRTASYYNKQVLEIWAYKMPYGLKLIDFGTDYSVNGRDRNGNWNFTISR